MQQFANTCEQVSGTTKKLEKKSLLAAYFLSISLEDAAIAAVFFSGRPFPMWEETTLQIGGSSLWRIVQDLSEKSETELSAAYRRHGDLGAVAGEVLPPREVTDLPLTEIQKRLRKIASLRGAAAKSAEVRQLLSLATPLEAKYIIKIMTGDLRIGLKESLVEEAIAASYDVPLAQTQRANMLLGDIGETLRYAAEGKLAQAEMRLFHPLGFMLASPAESAEDALAYFHNAWVEDKYDGIRAQAHCSGDEVKIFSRTRDEITESFPELPGALAGLLQPAVLDGEIVAWSYPAQASAEAGRALPFSALQQRLGRKKVSHELMRKVPVAFLAFDVLYAAGEVLIDRPLSERSQILEKLLAERISAPPRARAGQASLDFDGPEDDAEHEIRLIRAPVAAASTAKELDELFDAAQARGNEGLMIKDPESAYTPGRRGKSWLKLKRELATLDVVVTAVEYGHGKRVGVLSDYTFAVWNGDQLVNIGKAYSGLTDAEIAEMTTWFLAHTIDDQGFRLEVEPRIVLEVAFNNMMRSERHNSGFALRFPRIVRLRPDKLSEEADTIERVREIFDRQAS
jgi:ATP-dependent DNA ligase